MKGRGDSRREKDMKERSKERGEKQGDTGKQEEGREKK